MDTTLIIMAAGIGSRFGTGIKQLAKMAPNGEIIMDFSIYDAKEAGFTKVVFVIRKEIEKEFKEVIGNRLSKVMPVEYVYQELEDLSGMPLDQLTAYCLGADGVYGENGFDQLYHRFLEAPDTVLSYLALIDSWEERELLCTHLASADVSWYGGTEAFGAILDRLAGESGTSGELAELIQTEWKSLQ